LIGGQDVSETGFEVNADTVGVEVHLTTRPSRLEGSAKDAAGAAVAVGRLIVFTPDRADWIRPAARRYRSLAVKGDGTFVVTGLPAGSYLAALVPMDQDRYADPDFIDTLRAFATPFTISDGATTTITLRAGR
jgi:hypothetical protein